MNNRHIVIFDGVCNFCNGAVNFIINRDPDELFVFTPMQSQLAKNLMAQHQIPNVGIDTFVLIKAGRAYVFSNAALEIAQDLKGYWYLFTLFKLLPSSFRDFFYKLFARHRYRLFGRSDTCMMPTEELRARFVGIET
jgi:predicted DCC family thiol-disulfide oxidoreductase YuxK